MNKREYYAIITLRDEYYEKILYYYFKYFYVMCCSNKIECKLSEGENEKKTDIVSSIYYEEDNVKDVKIKITYTDKDYYESMCDFYKNNSKAINNDTVKCSNKAISYTEFISSDNNKILLNDAISYYESLGYTCDKGDLNEKDS